MDFRDLVDRSSVLGSLTGRVREFREVGGRREPIELLRRDIQEMRTNLLWVIQDNTLDHDELRDVQGQLGRMLQAPMDRLGISFPPPKDVPDDSKTDDDPKIEFKLMY
ncbi:hypothetical protein Syun_019097 [Stephania yunnanensis]|uniref:Uncharacterized protein n=1 Tax=Stephania yunnanensis TaxID=152371 RepID=A0AAP0NXM7_9MAGN